MIESVRLGITTSMFTRALGFKTNPVANAGAIHNGKTLESGGASGSTSDTEMSAITGDEVSEGTSTNVTVTGSPRLNSEQSLAISKAKVKALNKTGRVDWCLQEGVFENAYLSALSGELFSILVLEVTSSLVYAWIGPNCLLFPHRLF